MARAKAAHTAGFIAVSLADWMASEGAPGEPLIEMELHLGEAGSSEQGVGQLFLGIVLQQRCGHPERLESPDDPADLAAVAVPPDIAWAGADAKVCLENVMVMFFAPGNVPPMVEGHAADFGLRLEWAYRGRDRCVLAAHLSEG